MLSRHGSASDRMKLWRGYGEETPQWVGQARRGRTAHPIRSTPVHVTRTFRVVGAGGRGALGVLFGGKGCPAARVRSLVGGEGCLGVVGARLGERVQGAGQA